LSSAGAGSDVTGEQRLHTGFRDRADLGLAMAAVESTGSTAPLGSHAAEIYAKYNTDHADKDFSAVIELIRNG
jgi:3-hydroxyisobutyrate dehydrogenase-like beta-hydroxyacid dehydrogenase